MAKEVKVLVACGSGVSTCYKKESCRFTSETRRRIRTGKV